jgi:hypothetical protein
MGKSEKLVSFYDFKRKVEAAIRIAESSESLNEYVRKITDAGDKDETFTVETVVTGDCAQFTPPMTMMRREFPVEVVLNPTALKFVKRNSRVYSDRYGEEGGEILNVIAAEMQKLGRF